MTTAYSAAIQITFDKIIVTDPDVITGTEVVITRATYTPISSGDYSGYPKANAFDGGIATYWRSASATMPQWIGADLGEARNVSKARFYLNSYKPGNYEMQYSDNGTDWNTIASGTFTATTGWQEVTWAAASHRYWRLYVTSRQSSYLYIYEMQLWETRNTYDVSGWAVTGNEPSMVLGGQNVESTYDVHRVTKTEDNLSVILWLDLYGRMLYPQGNVTVNFTGDLRGEGNVSVLPFEAAFAPINIDKMFNPNDIEKVEISALTSTATLTHIYYLSGNHGPEKVEIAAITPTATLTHIDDL